MPSVAPAPISRKTSSTSSRTITTSACPAIAIYRGCRCPAHESRDGHLHPRGGSDAAHRIGGAAALDGQGQGRPPSLPARVHVRDPPRRIDRRVLPDRSEGFVDDRRGREKPPHV